MQATTKDWLTSSFIQDITSIGPRICRHGIEGGITSNPRSNLLSTEEEIWSILSHVRLQALG